MGDVAIRVENLGKKYRIGGPAERYLTFRDTLANFVKSALRRLSASPTQEEIWALKDVSFEIKQGETVGIIGRNGAGKSTLLKILSRITEPTEGRVTLKGRVASLLEVGTGFHPELTGRENIFLNGAILGMTKAEIKSKFDEIVAFAEIEKFLDTPVKRYSSGMYVRLAFAVAAHLEPEILLVDEVLAVGDAQFQKKCLGKMGEVSKDGRTVLFVSHNMASIIALCRKAMVLDDGQTSRLTEADEAVNNYLQSSRNNLLIPLSERKDRYGTGTIRCTGVRICNAENQQVDVLKSGDEFNIFFDFACSSSSQTNRSLSFSFRTMDDLALMILNTAHYPKQIGVTGTNGSIQCKISKLPLYPGKYSITVVFHENDEVADCISNAMVFEVHPGDFYGSGKIITTPSPLFLVDHEWQLI